MIFFRFLTLLLIGLIFLPAPAGAATILPVPFSTQAPQGAWRTEPFADACEEASLLMVQHFYTHAPLSKKIMIAEIRALVKTELRNFGFYKDTDANVMNQLVNDGARFTSHLVTNPALTDIVAELDAGHPVIMPAYVPALKNPHYHPRNPYHVIVIIGYDSERQEFITNDPGTHFGSGYRYPVDRLLNANRDWNWRDTQHGAHVMLFTAPNI